MKKVVITGATSMLGVALINECIRNNIEMLLLMRPGTKKSDRIPRSDLITVAECDLSDIKGFALSSDTASSYDVFFHLGWASTDKSLRDDPTLQYANIGYTLDAVGLAARLFCRTFIGAGSQAEYGRVNEKISPSRPVNPDTSYGAAKYTAGKLSAKLCGQYGIKHIWTRIFSSYGIYDGENTLVSHIIRSLLNAQKPSLTKCEQLWDYINCNDVASAIYLLGEKGKDNTVYNIGSGIARPLSEYVAIIHNTIDPTLPLGLGEKPYSENQVMYLCADIDNLKNDTGFEPKVQFDEGIRRLVEWYRKNI